MAKKGVLTKSDYLPYEEFLSTLEKLREEALLGGIVFYYCICFGFTGVGYSYVEMGKCAK